MKVKVNQGKCIGCGACPSLVPEVFDFNDEGLAYAKVEVVKDEDKEVVEDAIRYCPTAAIEEVNSNEKE